MTSKKLKTMNPRDLEETKQLGEYQVYMKGSAFKFSY